MKKQEKNNPDRVSKGPREPGEGGADGMGNGALNSNAEPRRKQEPGRALLHGPIQDHTGAL